MSTSEPVSAYGSPPSEEYAERQFEHQREISIPIPFAGNEIRLTVADGQANAQQRADLAAGLEFREPPATDQTNTAAHSHEQLKGAVDAANPGHVDEIGKTWNEFGNALMRVGARLDGLATDEAGWVGQASESARETLHSVATWTGQSGQGLQYMGDQLRVQADAASKAQSAMPEPVPYDPMGFLRQMLTASPAQWPSIAGDAWDQYNKHTAAEAQARQVAATYTSSLTSTNRTMPAFAPPPSLTEAGRPLTPGPADDLSVQPTGSVPPRLAGQPPPAAVQPPPPVSWQPPGWTRPPPDLIQPAPTPPAAPPGPPGGPGWPGTSGPPSAPSIPGGPDGLPGGGLVAGGPGRGAGAGGADTRDGRGGAGTSGGTGGPSARGGGFGPGGGGAAALADGGTGGRGIAGARGATGAAGGFAPAAGAAGRREEDREHRRPGYLIETEDVFGDGTLVAPPVIGGILPEHYRRD